MARRKTLADMIEAELEAKGWAKKVAAKRCGLTYTTFTDIASGRTREPPLATLQALATGLGLSMYDLMEATYGTEVMRGLQRQNGDS